MIGFQAFCFVFRGFRAYLFHARLKAAGVLTIKDGGSLIGLAMVGSPYYFRSLLSRKNGSKVL